MLNYLNKCVYLPKMASLKYQNRGVCCVLDNRGVQGGAWNDRGEMKASTMWEYLPMKLCMPLTVIVVEWVAHVGGVKLDYLS